MYSGTSTSAVNCAALIPPQTINGNFLQIVTNVGTATYSLSSKQFVSGSSYQLTITVNAAAIGTTVAITGWTGTGNVTVQPTETNAPANAAAVDLGLSVKWANMNVGATAVTDYGTYFAWGETSGYTVVGATTTAASGNVKTYFDWNTYAWCKGTYNTLTKYCPTDKQGSHWWDTAGSTVAADNKTVLELGDDAARANWGGKWRMPTKAEVQELIDTKSNTSNYTWTWCDGSSVKYNNTTVKGYKVESKKSGTSGNHIFIPAAGIIQGTDFEGQGVNKYGMDRGYQGYYLTSTLLPNFTGDVTRACYYNLRSDEVSQLDFYRNYGYTVRAVQSN